MSTMAHFGKGVMRVAKNYTKGYSDVQAKVRDATSNDPWGPSGTQMNEIAQMTYNQNDFIEIIEMLEKRVNDKGKNWRHVFKSLTVIDYLLHAGSENVVIYFKDNDYVIKTLKEFQYIDEDGKDQGANVRQKAKDIANLLRDEARLKQERSSRAGMRERMVRGRGVNSGEDDWMDENSQRRSRSLPPRRQETDGDLQRAIEESKRTLAEEQARLGRMTAEERDLQQAIRLSEEEEAKRARAVADANQNSLFDEHNQNSLINLSASAPNNTNPFPLVDVSGGLQPQFTMQPQYTSFNPYQQQMQQEAMQAEYMRQQQEWMQQQQLLQQQQQAQLQTAQQEEWMRQQLAMQQQQQQQQQMLMAQPTGFASNNPFAPSPSPVPPMPSFSHASSPGPAPQSSTPQFNLQGTYANGASPTSPIASPPPQSHSAPPRQNSAPAVKTRADDQHAHLANLLSNREDGIDTFGNFGQLRFGQQAGRLLGQPTGQPHTAHNPFAQQQQQQQQQQQGEQPFFSL